MKCISTAQSHRYRAQLLAEVERYQKIFGPTVEEVEVLRHEQAPSGIRYSSD